MGLISQTEAEFILQGFQIGIRNDGRLPLEHRPISLQTGILQQSGGSARCQIGLTDVMVSVKVPKGDICPFERLQLHVHSTCSNQLSYIMLRLSRLRMQADIGIPFPEEPDLGSVECTVAVSPCALKVWSMQL